MADTQLKKKSMMYSKRVISATQMMLLMFQMALKIVFISSYLAENLQGEA